MKIEWEEPPPTASVIGSGQHPGRYLEFALALREQPGRWAVLPNPAGDERSEKGAAATAQNIRRGKVKGFAPANTYETAVQGSKIWVRYKEKAETSEAAEDGKVPQQATTEDRPDPADVRAWAKDQGIRVSERGALPKHVFDRYAEALEAGETGVGLKVVRDK